MKPLVILVVISLLSLPIVKMVNGTYDYAFSARVGMSAMLIFTAIGHFTFTKGMAMMVPDAIPYKVGMVYLTAVLEILLAFALHFSNFRSISAWSLIVFFILLLPANIKAAMQHIDFQNATFDGKGLPYLWFRVPLQIFFILWVYFSCLK